MILKTILHDAQRRHPSTDLHQFIQDSAVKSEPMVTKYFA